MPVQPLMAIVDKIEGLKMKVSWWYFPESEDTLEPVERV